MALILHLKSVDNLRSTCNRKAKVTFRGVCHYSKVIENAAETAIFDEIFEWPVARPIESEESLDIQIFNYSKYLNNRLIGTFRIILQELIEVGHIEVSDSLLDSNNVAMKTKVDFELTYNAPDGSVGIWQKGGFEDVQNEDEITDFTDDDKSLIDKRKRHSLPSSPLKSRFSSVTGRGSLGVSPTGAAKFSSLVKNVMKQRPDDDNRNAGDEIDTAFGTESSCTDDDQHSESQGSTIMTPTRARRPKTQQHIEHASLRARDFQVCVTIIEARQLAGLNMDPVVCVTVGDQKRYTSVKESTNCPYYNEYFVFDFHMAPAMLFDQIITITVCQAGRLLRSNKPLGSFKLDVATVFANTDHQFYHKWAMLTDPDDINAGVKGYVKCDLAVIGNGDSIKVPPKNDHDDDDIESNLLLPEGVPVDRQRARFIVKIYKAEGLPKMNTGIMANVKRALTGEARDLVDPFVQVSFAGRKGKTSVRKGAYEPVWNEQLVFNEMFPPLCRRIKIQLRDNDSVNDDVIGTHFIDLGKISNEGEKGFLPTYGPTWVNLYGSTRYYSLLSEHTYLNDGLGEGVSYRGRLLIAVSAEIVDNLDAITQVDLESCSPLPETAGGKKEEYFLFGSILEATMIDKKVGEKPVHFEMSIGNAGNVLDGYNSPTNQDEESSEETGESEDEKSTSSNMGEVPQWQSTTPPVKPVTKDRIYYIMPYYEEKPCMYVKENFEDHRRRMYNTNILRKIITKLENGLNEVQELINQELPFPERRLRGVLEELGLGCSRYVSLVKSSSGCGSPNKTKLDKERSKLLIREIDQMSTMARTLKATITKNNMRDKLRSSIQYLQKLQNLVEEPQHALPDVFTWMISGSKRVACQRIPVESIIYSIVDEEKGKDCGKVQTLFLRLPGKKASGQAGWSIQAKLQIYLWLGLSKHKKDFLNGLPKGYEETKTIKQANRLNAMPPQVLNYKEKQMFQLRAHMYQARSLIASDATGLSDPFARVIFGDQCVMTQVIEETLSPTWDEMLIINELVMFGQMDQISEDPPAVVVEIFDQDKVGKAEFIGRAVAKPIVKMYNEKYCKPKFPPKLEWWDIYRGSDRAGELLATFELLQLAPFGDMSGQDLPPMDMPEAMDSDRGTLMPVPKGIRPILSKHRVEVLFWGVRDLKRLQLTHVDRPRIDIECAGHVLQSSVIANAKKNPNFSILVKFFDVELPENELYCPPITIRCVDCRSFGRFVLVGSHIIKSLSKFMYVPTTKRAKDALKKLFPGRDLDAAKVVTEISTKAEDVAITIDEKQPLISRDQVITIDAMDRKDQKTAENKRRRKAGIDEEEPDLESLDWWSKYFVSVETMIRDHYKKDDLAGEGESKDSPTHKVKPSEDTTGYGAIPNGKPNSDDPEYNAKHAKKMEKELKKMEKKEATSSGKIGFRATAKAASFASRLSPKTQRKKDRLLSATSQLKVFPQELEVQLEYRNFTDWLHTFELYRGKKISGDDADESRVVGKFKGSLKIYKIPLPPDIEDTTITGGDPQYGLFQGLPSNDPIKVLVRVYVVKANDLHPSDINGKADPYLVIRLGKTVINDKEHYISKQLNPVFGKCYEIEATFPVESLLSVQVYDWDLVGLDDLIGETKIDLENRFYSRHRATCGIAKKYELTGYNAWRDPMKPTQILAKLCKDGKVDGPHYQPGKVRVSNRIFTAPVEVEDENGVKNATEEHLALAALNHWEEIPKVGCKLVPEHVETRPLCNPERPGIEQGKLEMWVDMFPMDMPPPGPPVDISPRKPKSYELRCVIWNTDDVVLEDDAFFTGEKMSDIYVKGWIKGQEDLQCTDIHYRSLTGEGNFNWRFIFPFDYLLAEEKIVISRKETLFSWDETETKIPARLNLQVWDADHFSADDFLGSLTLDLNHFPRGAKSSKLCTLDMLKTDGTVPQMSLFKHKRVKGWWPFAVKNENNDEYELTGKVEAELHLLTTEDAEKHPAGLGRNEPDPLEKPNRPDSSFIWFLNPLKSIRYILWHNYKWVILKIIIFILVVILLALFFYSLPGYTVKRMLGA